MFSRPEVVVPTAVLDLQQSSIVKSPALMATAYERAIRGLRQEFTKEAGTPKGPHQRPTDWQTAKQRRWWWAVGVFQWRGRTGTLEKSWKTDLKVTVAGGIFRAWNTAPYAVFVQGRQVQRMHRQVWQQESDLFPKYSALASARLRETWFTVTDPKAGVRP